MHVSDNVVFGRFPNELDKLNTIFLGRYLIVIALELWGHLLKNHVLH